MSAAKHTPGPWTLDLGGKNDFGVIWAPGRFVCEFLEDPTPEDGRLITAAPRLLAAVSRLLREDADGHITIGCIEDAREAFIKAGGVL